LRPFSNRNAAGRGFVAVGIGDVVDAEALLEETRLLRPREKREISDPTTARRSAAETRFDPKAGIVELHRRVIEGRLDARLQIEAGDHQRSRGYWIDLDPSRRIARVIGEVVEIAGRPEKRIGTHLNTMIDLRSLHVRSTIEDCPPECQNHRFCCDSVGHHDARATFSSRPQLEAGVENRDDSS
jgi:hypothetical protein